MAASAGTFVTAHTGGATSLTSGSIGTTNVGDVLIITCTDGGNGTPAGSDSKSNTGWTAAGTSQTDVSGVRGSMLLCENIANAGAAHTLTASYGATNNISLGAGSILGTAGAGAVDTGSLTQVQDSASPYTNTSNAPAQADDYWLSLFIPPDAGLGTEVYTQPSTWALLAQITDRNTSYCHALAGKAINSASAQTVTWADTSTTDNRQLKIVAIKSAVAGGTAVNPGVGSLAITGYAPTIAQPHGVAPGVGSLTLTGYAPTVSQPQAVAPGVGSLAITGYAPTIAQPHAVASGVGALTITGYAPSIAQPQTAAPGVGTIAITGYAPTVTQQAGQSVNPGVGTVAITGFAPAVAQTANQAVAPGVGSVVITGYAPAVTQASGANAVDPGAGVLVITGYAPAVSQTGASTGGGIDPGERTDGYPRGGKRSRNREPDWLKPRNAEALEALQDAIEGEATANAVARATEATDAIREAQERAESQRLLMQSQMDVAAMLGEQMRIAKAQQIQQIQQARADALVLEDEEALAVLLML